MVKTPPKVFWGGFKGEVPSQKVFGPLRNNSHYFFLVKHLLGSVQNHVF